MAEGEGSGNFRKLDGATGVIASILLALVTVLGGAWSVQLHQHLGQSFYKEQMLGAVLGFALAACFLCAKARRGEPSGRVPLYDWVLAALGLLCGLYLAVLYPQISLTLRDVNA